MDVLGYVGGVFGKTVVNTTLGVVGGAVMWPVMRMAYDKMKPINVLSNALKKDAYKLGFKISTKAISTVPDQITRKKMLDDAIISAEDFKVEFIRGLKGE